MPETVPPSVLSNFTSPHTIGRRRSPQRKTSTHRTTIPKVTATQGHCPTSGMVTPDTRSHACIGRAPSPRGSYTWGHSLTHRETVYQRHNHTKRQKQRETIKPSCMGYSLKHKDTAPRTWHGQIQCHRGTAHKGYNHTEKCTQTGKWSPPHKNTA